MKAVENNDDYEIVNPRTKEVVDRYNAREIFKKIVFHAWKNGDPGIIFLDRLNRDNPTPHIGVIDSTNPCVSGDTYISTNKGYIKAKDLHEKIQHFEDINIIFDKRALAYKIDKNIGEGDFEIFESSTISSWNRGLKDIYRLRTYSGYSLDATPDHKILTLDGYRKISCLKKGDEILIQPFGKFNTGEKIFTNGIVKRLNKLTGRKVLDLPEYWSSELGEILGWLIGDGWLRNDRVGFTFGKDDRELVDYFKNIIAQWYNYSVKEIIRDNEVVHLSYHAKAFIEYFKKLGVKLCKSINKETPSSIFNATEEAVSGFLRGLFSADGNIDNTDGIIKISSASKKLLEDVQILLLNFGIKSVILNRKYSFSKNFTYINKEGVLKTYRAGNDNYYELFISGGTSKRRFQNKIGFLLEQKNILLDSFKFEKLSPDNYYNKFIDKVESVEFIGQKEVFDFNEPVSNSFIANGIVVRNCGEQPLLPYEACNLGSINLAHMVKYEEGVPAVDYEKLKNVIKIAVRFLDDVIDMSKYPLEKIREMVDKNRKIGLGVMGWADLLIILGIPYNSEQALELSREVMGFVQEESKKESSKLAEERGSFPNFKGSIYDSPDGYEIRNATTTTIAPTGTLSIIANCSSGVEPIFAISFVKNVMDNEKLVEVNPYFEEVAKKMNFYSKELMEDIADHGSAEGFDIIPDSVKRIFVTAHQVSPVWHVRMQAAFQEYVDNAVSKTVNFPNDATEDDVEDVYMLAYRLGCKGITIYRDGSREMQVLQVEKKNKKTTQKEDEKTNLKEDLKIKETAIQKEVGKVEKTGSVKKEHTEKKAQELSGEQIKPIKPRPRPEVTAGITKKYTIGGCGKLYVTVNSDEKGICEVFTNTGEEGCAALSEAISRLISITIRSGIDIDAVLKQIGGIRCITCIADEKTHVLSCPDAIGKALEYTIKGSNKFDFNVTSGPKSIMICPEEGCGGIMEPEGGCYVCRNCGFSKCS
jgi:ribonucleoside-diphosphate reductase alpha chain